MSNLIAAVELIEACKSYLMGSNRIAAVNNVSLRVDAGEFTALLGSSGSGKSTLLNLMAGLDRPSSGSVKVYGRDLSGMSSADLTEHRRRTVGMVFQSFNLIASMTVYENVELPMRFAEVSRNEREAKVHGALERVGLSRREGHRPSELSGGEQQRVSLARALVNGPRLLLADEPTGNLDSRTGKEIMDLILDLNRDSGMTVIMVTHERSLADRYARRLLFMADGRLASDEEAALAKSGADFHEERS
jgi:putative ABC transport system ATP-binding protein